MMMSRVQETMVQSLAGILRPIIRLLLHCGLGYAEFEAIAKSVFVVTASQEFGIRGRPTNVSRIAAITGLSRKQVSRIRADHEPYRWSPDMEANPVNTVIHYWHYDSDFSETSGPKVLRLEGPGSFSQLVRRYVGDIPTGALKAELCRSGVAAEVATDQLKLIKRYYFPSDFQDDYIRKIAFSMRNLGNTLAHNADLVRQPGASEELHREHGRFERFAWSERLSEDAIRRFQAWTRLKGGDFVESADDWIGRHEIPRSEWGNSPPKVAGVGVYFFVEE